MEWSVSSSYSGIKEHLPDISVGNSSRLPFSTPFTGHNLVRKQAYTDFQMPKQYWWSAGVAGFRGTIANWVATLVDWNPGLDEDLASEWFGCAFDYPMPSDYPVSAYESEATDEWFTTSVRDQTRKMMAAAETVDPVRPIRGAGAFWFELADAFRIRPHAARDAEPGGDAVLLLRVQQPFARLLERRQAAQPGGMNPAPVLMADLFRR